MEKYYDANNIKLLNRSPTVGLTTMDIREVAGIDFCALQAPDGAEILIASAGDVPLGIVLQYGKGAVIAIGDSSFLADLNVNLNRSKFFNYLIYRLTGELFWREF